MLHWFHKLWGGRAEVREVVVLNSGSDCPEIGSHCVTRLASNLPCSSAVLELTLLWPLPPRGWDYRHAPAHPVNSWIVWKFFYFAQNGKWACWCPVFSLGPHIPREEHPHHYKVPGYVCIEISALSRGDLSVMKRPDMSHYGFFPVEEASDEGRGSR